MTDGPEAPLPVRRRGWRLAAVVAGAVLVAAAIAVPAVKVGEFLVTQSTGRVTTVVENGSTRTVHWKEYPGIAGLNPDDVLDGPTAEEGYARGEGMIAEIRAAVTAEFALQWAAQSPAREYDAFHEDVQNWFGGESMLTVVNGPSHQTIGVPSSWDEKQRILDLVGEIATEYGFSAPELLTAESLPYWTDEDFVREYGGTTPQTQVLVMGGLEGPAGQWLSFNFQDLSKDEDGRFAERLREDAEQGWQVETFSISYGANGLLPAEDRAEFERRLRPFDGLEEPPPLET